jgi:hypothetical protein
MFAFMDNMIIEPYWLSSGLSRYVYVCVTFPPEKRHLLSQVLDEVFDGLLPALSGRCAIRE